MRENLLTPELIEKIDNKIKANEKEFERVVSERGIKIIGVSGLARSGKDTVSDIIVNDSKVLAKRVSFAYSLKKYANDLFQKMISETLSSEIANNILDEFSKLHAKPLRQLYQVLGTETLRSIVSEHFWTNTLLKRIIDEDENIKLYVVSDVRFNNEARILKNFDGKIILVSRKDRGIDESKKVYSHTSEAGIDETFVDATINNDGTLEELPQAVQSIKSVIGGW